MKNLKKEKGKIWKKNKDEKSNLVKENLIGSCLFGVATCCLVGVV